jgi:chitodextrinase
MLSQLDAGVTYNVVVTKDGANFATRTVSTPSGGGAFVIPLGGPVNTTDTGNKYVNYVTTINGSNWSTLTVKVIVPDSYAPSAPGNLRTTAVQWNQINLLWDASTDIQLVDHYDVSVNGTVVSTPSSPGTGTSYVLSGLTQLTAYTIQVRAWDWAGNSSGWSTLAVTTPIHDTTAPTQPGQLIQSEISTTGFAVTWTPSGDNVGVAWYTVKLLQGGINGTVLSSQNVTTNGFMFVGLTAGTTYGVSVVAYDAAGNASTAQTAAFSTSSGSSGSQPGQPTGLAAMNVSGTSMTISWSAAVDGHAVAYYVINRDGTDTNVGQDGSGHPLTTYTYNGLTAGTTYQIKVKAVDPSNNSSVWSSAAGHRFVPGSAQPDPRGGHGHRLHG